MKIEIINRSDHPLPSYATTGAAGMDLVANNEEPILLEPLMRAIIPTGLYIALPEGVEAQVRARSGMAYKHGITVANGVGTIDCDYRGEIGVILVNLSKEDYTVNKGDRIAQLVIARVEQGELVEVEELSQTHRSDGGFGHTGY
ncbi:MAG: dUTP diphosphatase [Tissierellia bacterium]|nr:dUTP diphosphatase [Tissierellia bacterium]